jgi:hypothetical protein
MVPTRCIWDEISLRGVAAAAASEWVVESQPMADLVDGGHAPASSHLNMHKKRRCVACMQARRFLKDCAEDGLDATAATSTLQCILQCIKSSKLDILILRQATAYASLKIDICERKSYP